MYHINFIKTSCLEIPKLMIRLNFIFLWFLLVPFDQNPSAHFLVYPHKVVDILYFLGRPLTCHLTSIMFDVFSFSVLFFNTNFQLHSSFFLWKFSAECEIYSCVKHSLCMILFIIVCPSHFCNFWIKTIYNTEF